MKHIRIVLFLLLVWCCSVPCRAQELSPPARTELSAAQRLIDNKRYAEAVKRLQNFLDGAKDAPAAAYALLGSASYLAGNTRQAMRAFAKGHTLFPQDPDLCLNAAVAAFNCREYAAAGKFFEQAGALRKPFDPELLFKAATAYYQGQNYRAAAKAVRKLLSGRTVKKQSWLRLAIHVYLKNKDWKRASGLILRFLSRNPNDTAYWALLAKLHLEQRHYTDAAAALEILYRLKHPSSKEKTQLARMYGCIKAPLLAAAALEQTPGSPPSLRIELAGFYASAGRNAKALRLLEQTQKSGSGEQLLLRGKILFQARKFADAEAVFHKCARHSAIGSQAGYYLGLCAWERTNWDAARQAFARIVSDTRYGSLAANGLAILQHLRE